VAKVMHRRTIPRYNAFCYGVCYLSFNLSQLAALKNKLLAIDGRGLFSFKQSDHGDIGEELPSTVRLRSFRTRFTRSPSRGEQKNNHCENWVKSILRQYGLEQVVNGEVLVVAMPRMFGYLFNPVSFWLCHDAKGALRAVISEVNNTFREAHYYISFHDDMRVIQADDWLQSSKIFHVSPFMKIEGEYQYRFIADPHRIAIWINYYVDGKLMLETSLIGKRISLNSFNLLKYNLRYPLASMRVMGLIHWQAIKLISKRIKYHNKPHPPINKVSR
jgi:DUF1365 family protein